MGGSSQLPPHYSIMQNSFIALKILYALPIHPSPFSCPQLLATSYPFTLCIVLRFPECHVVSRIIQYRAFGDWLLLLINIHLNSIGDSEKLASLVAQRVEVSAWVGKIPWRREWQPTPVSLPEEFLGWRIPWTEEPGRLQSWRCKQSDRTE